MDVIVRLPDATECEVRVNVEGRVDHLYKAVAGLQGYAERSFSLSVDGHTLGDRDQPLAESPLESGSIVFVEVDLRFTAGTVLWEKYDIVTAQYQDRLCWLLQSAQSQDLSITELDQAELIIAAHSTTPGRMTPTLGMDPVHYACLYASREVFALACRYLKGPVDPNPIVFLLQGQRFRRTEGLPLAEDAVLNIAEQIVADGVGQLDVGFGTAESYTRWFGPGGPLGSVVPSNDTPLVTAIQADSRGVVDLLLRSGALVYLEDHPAHADTALAMACRKKDRALLATLLDAIPEGDLPAALAQTGSQGATALHVAACNVDCAALLLKHGAPVDQRDRFGDTPLLAAARANSVAAVSLLRLYGGDASIASRKGVLPADYARDYKNTALEQALRR